MINGKVEFALRDAEPEDLRQQLNTHMWCRSYPPKVQQPVRKTLMQLTVATREEGVWLVHPCFIGVSTWGQAEPAPPGWPASQHLSVTQSTRLEPCVEPLCGGGHIKIEDCRGAKDCIKRHARELSMLYVSFKEFDVVEA
ncbi:MAG: hypothetical protein FRX49_08039 [Trebouxia sp. A1-2]|nr:MAG: hypothetical protein FRX49_08039 [Trebouxia sp. A1-2]